MNKIIKFFSPICGPCKVMGRVLSTLEGVDIQEVDVSMEANEPIIQKWKVSAIPTILVVNESGELVKRFTGVVPIDKIKEVL